MTTRTIRLLRRLAIETGAELDDLLGAARALLEQNPKLSPDAIDALLRASAPTTKRLTA